MQFQQMKHFEVDIFIFSLMPTGSVISNLFLYCFLGKVSSESYKKMAVTLYDCSWFEFPLNLQKYFIMMIANAHIPLHYHGFGLIRLDLETFFQVRLSQLLVFDT